MASSNTVLIEQEQCVQKAAQVMQDECSSCADLCAIHDSLMQAFMEDESIQRIDADFLRLRLVDQPVDKEAMQRRILLQADLLRAVLVISAKLILQIGAVSDNPQTVATKTALETTIQKSKVLLQIAAHLYSEYWTDSDSEHAVLPSKFPIIQEWLDELEHVVGETDEVNIAFDREQLEQEEDELLHMASTPTPHEGQQRDQHSQPELLFAVRVATDASTLSISLDERGVFRSQQPAMLAASNKDTSIWLVNKDTTISYHSPNLLVSNVLTGPSELSSTELTLNVGKQGHVWWERISKSVHRLRATSDLQDQLQRSWSQDEFHAKQSQAKALLLAPSTTLN